MSRSAHADRDPDPAEPPDAIEELLARCLAASDAAALERLLADEPELAVHVRRRLQLLERVGLTGESSGGVQAPRTLGPYSVLRELGQGGMGVVYLARDARSGAEVALKTLQAGLFVSERSRARFEREVRAAAALSHPGIVPILEVGEEGGRPYFAMEYVQGATLAQAIAGLRARALAWAELGQGSLLEEVRRVAGASESRTARPTEKSYVEAACRIVIDVADALEHAHEHGVVHRDVKPANVLLGLDGRARLFDLGLAHLDELESLTATGDFAGTPAYVAPEQITGQKGAIDRRTDVYALGVTLYELLTLRTPFQGPNPHMLLRQIATREAPLLRATNPLVPRDLETICLTALEKDPARRYPSAAALAADLRRFLAFWPIEAQPFGPLRRGLRWLRHNPALGSALVLGALLVVGLPIVLLRANALISAQRDLALEHAGHARLEARRTEQVSGFLLELFRLPAEDGERARVHDAEELLDRAALRIDPRLVEEPLTQAALLEGIGRVYQNLGRPARAVPWLDQALALRELQPRPDPAVPRLLATLAEVHLEQANDAAVPGLCARALAELGREGRDDPRQRARVLAALAELAARGGEPARAVERAQECLAVLGGLDPPDERALAELLCASGRWRLAAGAVGAELATATRELEQALELCTCAWDPRPLAIVEALDMLALARARAGQRAEAQALLARGQRVLDRLFGSEGAATRAHALAQTAVREEELALALEATRAAWLRAPREAGAPPSEFELSFRSGITALQSRQTERALAAFERCLALDPRQPVCAYNGACALALGGDRDGAFAWLERALGAGFAARPRALESLLEDADLAELRADARFAAFAERVRVLARQAADYAGRPAVHVPSASVAGETRTLCALFHAEGSTKDALLDPSWRALSERLGLVLCAPSASIPLGADPAQGMRWFEDPAGALDRPWAAEGPLLAHLRTARETLPARRDVLLIAAEGSGGPAALRIAARASGWCRGVVLWGAELDPAWLGAGLSELSLFGLELHCLVTGMGEATTARQRALATRMAELGIAGSAREAPVGPDGRPAGLDALLGELAAAH